MSALIDNIKRLAALVRGEKRSGGNTAERIGGIFAEIAEELENKADSAEMDKRLTAHDTGEGSHRKILEQISTHADNVAIHRTSAEILSQITDKDIPTTLARLAYVIEEDENVLQAAREYAAAKVAEVVNSSPATLDTLQELAAALGNDPNFATSIMALIGGKADTVHSHPIGQVGNLQAELNKKLGNSGNQTLNGEVLNIDSNNTSCVSFSRDGDRRGYVGLASGSNNDIYIDSLENIRLTTGKTIYCNDREIVTANNCKCFYEISVGGDSGHFYPVTWVSVEKTADISIHSEGFPRISPYNQNILRFHMSAYGWGDVPKSLIIDDHGLYEANEITIHSVWTGSHEGVNAVYLRGGLRYFVESNVELTPRLSRFIHGNEVYEIMNGDGSVANTGTVQTWNYTAGRTVAVKSDIPASLPANGGNADTLDNKHAADLFVSNNGDMQLSDIDTYVDRSSGTYKVDYPGGSNQLTVFKCSGSSSALEFYNPYNLYELRVRTSVDSSSYSNWSFFVFRDDSFPASQITESEDRKFVTRAEKDKLGVALRIYSKFKVIGHANGANVYMLFGADMIGKVERTMPGHYRINHNLNTMGYSVILNQTGGKMVWTGEPKNNYVEVYTGNDTTYQDGGFECTILVI